MSKKLLSFSNFNKGINTTAYLDELDASELITAVNIDLNPKGGYSQRLGCSLYKILLDENEETLTYPINHLIDFPNKPLLIINKKLMDFDGNIIVTLNSNEISYEFFTNSMLYILDGTEYWVYDGTTCIAVIPTSGCNLTAIKRCTKLIQRGQRMFILGDPQNPNFLYFSEIGDPAHFLASSIVKAVTDDNDILTGLALFSNSLLAFKKDNIFRWSGWDPDSEVEFIPLDTGHGTINNNTIKISEGFLIFADSDGVFCLNTIETGLIKSFNSSKNIKLIYSSLTNLDKMRSIVYKGDYYLACCDNGTGINNKILKASINMVYNDDSTGVSNVLFPWVEYRGWEVGDFIIIDEDLYFSSAKEGKIYKAFDGVNDVNIPVSSEATHYLKFEDTVIRKKLKKLFVSALQDATTACTIRLDIEAGYNIYAKTINFDESGAWDQREWDEALWDWVDIIVKEIRISLNISRIKIKLSHSVLNEKMSIYGFASYYKSKKPRGDKNGISDISLI